MCLTIKLASVYWDLLQLSYCHCLSDFFLQWFIQFPQVTENCVWQLNCLLSNEIYDSWAMSVSFRLFSPVIYPISAGDWELCFWQLNCLVSTEIYDSWATLRAFQTFLSSDVSNFCSFQGVREFSLRSEQLSFWLALLSQGICIHTVWIQMYFTWIMFNHRISVKRYVIYFQSKRGR